MANDPLGTYVDPENLDNQLENYFFNLVLIKDVILTALESLRDVWTRDLRTGFALTWLANADKDAMTRIIFGPDATDIHTRIKRGILADIEHVREQGQTELGNVFFLLLQIFESVINVPDADSLRFIMNQKKEDVEVMLLAHTRRIIAEYAENLEKILAEHRTMIERTPEDTFHESEMRRIESEICEMTNATINRYSIDSEIEGIISGFIRENQMFTKRF